MKYATTEGAQGICPTGWHIPGKAEWEELGDFLGGYQVAGGQLKEAGTVHWFFPNTGATNSSGFYGLPGGYRHDLSGEIYDLGIRAHFWSSTQLETTRAWRWDLDYNDADLGPGDGNWPYGFSLRCVQN
jgi:uncharacterized protein (TIGR02145 family)